MKKLNHMMVADRSVYVEGDSIRGDRVLVNMGEEPGLQAAGMDVRQRVS